MENQELLGACGLYCGACKNYHAYSKGKNFTVTIDDFKGRQIEDVICKGCHSDLLQKHCFECLIRLCALEKEIEHCGLCSDFPCEKSEEVYNRDKKYGARHCGTTYNNIKRLNDIGINKWLNEEGNFWKCECGESLEWYQTSCIRCGKPSQKSLKNRNKL